MARVPNPRKTLSGELKKTREQGKRQSNSSTLFGTGLEVIDPGQTLNNGVVIVPAGGMFLVDGGDVIMLNAALVEVFRLGIQTFGDRGLTVRREDGSIVYRMAKPFSPTDVQKFQTFDSLGRITGGDSVLALSGFDAPHQRLHFTPTDYTSAALAQATTSTTFVATHESRDLHQNPALKPQFMARCSDGTTAGEIQVWDVINGAYLGGYLGTPATHTVTVPAGTTTFTAFEPATAMQLPGSMSDLMHLQIHVRRTAGTGSVTVAPVRTTGSGF